MVVSAQPVAPSFGTVEPTLILPPARSALTWYGQEVEATTPSEVKSSTCAAASPQYLFTIWRCARSSSIAASNCGLVSA